nr:hypothetical protein [bacterium]
VRSAPTVWNNGNQARVYVGLGGPANAVIALSCDDTSASQDWSYDAQGPVVGSPVLTSDSFPHDIVFGSLAGKVFCCNYTGDDVFAEPFVTFGEVRGTPAIGPDGTIYAGDTEGDLVALTAAGVERWTFNGGGPIYGGIALDSSYRAYFGSGNMLYAVRDFTTEGVAQLAIDVGSGVNATPALEEFNGVGRVYFPGGNLHAAIQN